MDAPQTALSVMETVNPVVVLTDREKFNCFYDDMKRETDALKIDLTTEMGRKNIASMAYKVARTKTAIDDAGKQLTADWRKQIGLVDESRREIRNRLDALKDAVRRPLTEWESAKEKRDEDANYLLECIRSASAVTVDDTSETVSDRIEWLQAVTTDEDRHGHYVAMIKTALVSATATLATALARIRKEESDRAELDRLRALDAERIEREREAAERAERERIESERAEQAKIAVDAAKKAEAERIAKAASDAESKAKAEAEAAHAAQMAEAKRRADEAEAKIKAAAVHAERERVEQAARDADRQHRASVMGEAKRAIIALGADEDVAKKIVLAILAGEIPAVSLRF